MKYLGWLVLAISLLAGLITARLAPGAASAAPTVEWDARLDALHVSYQPASDCAAGCWRLVSARYEDPNESGGQHHIWARTLNADGSQRADETWNVGWPGGLQPLRTKGSGEWADFGMYGPGGCYNHDAGPGPFRAYAGNVESRSDRVLGMGLPQCQHVNFRLTWQWSTGAPAPTATATPRPATATVEPSVTAEPSVTVEPTATPDLTPEPVMGEPVGPLGGVLQLWGDKTIITIVIPEGSLDRPGMIHHRLLPSEKAAYPLYPIGEIWEWWITYEDGTAVRMNKAAEIEQTFRYNLTSQQGPSPALYSWQDGRWIRLDASRTLHSTTAATTMEFGMVGVLHEGFPIYLPSIVR